MRVQSEAKVVRLSSLPTPGVPHIRQRLDFTGHCLGLPAGGPAQSAAPIILVASARYLAARPTPVFRDFVNQLKRLSHDAEHLLASVEPPRAYSRSLLNAVFTVQLYRRILRLAQLPPPKSAQ
jgi:hypothetical protein